MAVVSGVRRGVSVLHVMCWALRRGCAEKRCGVFVCFGEFSIVDYFWILKMG